jgi:hypothetical protein
MDQTLTAEFQNKTTIEENSESGKNLVFFVPPNTTVFTKEMVRKLDREQRVIRKELERYDSWFNTIKFQIFVAIGKLKSIRIFLKLNYKR